MAVVSVDLLFTGRGGTDDFKKHRTYTRVYQVITDDPNDAEQVVGNAEGLPVIGDPFGEDEDAVVVSCDAEQSDDSMLIWYLTFKYDTEPPLPQSTDFDGNPVQPNELPENPLNEPATWKLTSFDTDEPVIEGREVTAVGGINDLVPKAWAAKTLYAPGAYATSGANVYVQTAKNGVSGVNGPTVGPGGSETHYGEVWMTGTPYNVGDVVGNANKVYRCTVAGTSAGGPTGEGGSILDGTCRWEYFGEPSVWVFVDTLANIKNDPNAGPFVMIRNSAGMPFDPPPMTTVSRPVLTVTKNIPFTTLAYTMSLKNSVNVIAWKGIPARCAKVLKIDHDGGKYKNGIAYVTTSWEIGLDPETWDLRLLDCGFQAYERLPSDPITHEQKIVRKTIKDRDGESIQDPSPLDGNGFRLDPGADPVYLRFIPRQVRLIDFNQVMPF